VSSPRSFPVGRPGKGDKVLRRFPTLSNSKSLRETAALRKKILEIGEGETMRIPEEDTALAIQLVGNIYTQ
jgi:hypothetical protein